MPFFDTSNISNTQSREESNAGYGSPGWEEVVKKPNGASLLKTNSLCLYLYDLSKNAKVQQLFKTVSKISGHATYTNSFLFKGLQTDKLWPALDAGGQGDGICHWIFHSNHQSLDGSKIAREYIWKVEVLEVRNSLQLASSLQCTWSQQCHSSPDLIVIALMKS